VGERVVDREWKKMERERGEKEREGRIQKEAVSITL